MLKPDPRAGGCFLSLLILAGFTIGVVRNAPLVWTLAGTVLGIAVAFAVWVADRRRKRD